VVVSMRSTDRSARRWAGAGSFPLPGFGGDFGRWPDQRLLYMSAHPAEILARHGLKDPDVPFLAKPSTRVELLAKVNAALGRLAAGEGVSNGRVVERRTQPRLRGRLAQAVRGESGRRTGRCAQKREHFTGGSQTYRRPFEVFRIADDHFGRGPAQREPSRRAAGLDR
jgi:hypothetical protein